MIRAIFRLLGLILSLASTGITILLLWVGFKAGWTSDGPGMLLIMIGVVVFGGISMALWKMTLSGLGRNQDG